MSSAERPAEIGPPPYFHRSDCNLCRLAVVASGMTRHRNEAAIRIRNRYAALHVARLEPGQSVAVPDAPFVQVA